MSEKKIPLAIPLDVTDLYEGAPSEQRITLVMQQANLDIANALTALAIHYGAMTEDGQFISPQPMKTADFLTPIKEIQIPPTEEKTEGKSEPVKDGGDS